MYKIFVFFLLQYTFFMSSLSDVNKSEFKVKRNPTVWKKKKFNRSIKKKRVMLLNVFSVPIACQTPIFHLIRFKKRR
ncbi:hypothetical protein EDC94DRAFT_604836 [Helicostylum pulchrum]|nr:hypothetical protein EDC94DRAFT_604836 [Helicostylum pulchrum]